MTRFNKVETGFLFGSNESQLKNLKSISRPTLAFKLRTNKKHEADEGGRVIECAPRKSIWIIENNPVLGTMTRFNKVETGLLFGSNESLFKKKLEVAALTDFLIAHKYFFINK